jgi:hypothetical protein
MNCVGAPGIECVARGVLRACRRGSFEGRETDNVGTDCDALSSEFDMERPSMTAEGISSAAERLEDDDS